MEEEKTKERNFHSSGNFFFSSPFFRFLPYFFSTLFLHCLVLPHSFNHFSYFVSNFDFLEKNKMIITTVPIEID
jgi:hypothetical protein